MAHYDRILGGKGPTELVESGGPVSILQYVDFEVGVTHYATLGMAAVAGEMLNPSELVISVRPGQDDWARTLLTFVLNSTNDLGDDITFGSALVSQQTPVMEGLPIYGYVLDASPWTDQLDLVLTPDGASIELAVLTVIPMTKGDTELLMHQGIEAYDAALEITDADVYDLFRTVTI